MHGHASSPLILTPLALQVAAGGTGVGASAAPVIAGAGGFGDDGIRIMTILAMTIVAIAVLYPIARAFAKRMERGEPSKTTNAGSDARLSQLEQSVEALTLEIERISEGQRYTTKLLTERLPLAAKVPQPGQSEKTLL